MMTGARVVGPAFFADFVSAFFGGVAGVARDAAAARVGAPGTGAGAGAGAGADADADASDIGADGADG
ncbi:MAG: hypothetical protein JWO86_8960 [Myxococcaceae bacterium]|nr:hypothetical protein [Myxococcaceae bacterium]